MIKGLEALVAECFLAATTAGIDETVVASLEASFPGFDFEVAPIGLGCINLSHAYGTPPRNQEAQGLLHEALDLGYDMLDTAALYGFGANESLIGETLKSCQSDFVLASKCGMCKGPDGKRAIDGRPETLRKTCEDSLRRLQTDVTDLYYLHRWDKTVPIEESVGLLSDLVTEGKIRAIGLSEVSALTLHKAHTIHPIAAVQTEYSLWTRNPELTILEVCEQLGVTFVAFSPLARAFLCDTVHRADQLEDGDIRRAMPRFDSTHLPQNLALLEPYRAMAKELGATPAQLALAWLLNKADHIIPIPGTKNRAHMIENFAAHSLVLNMSDMDRLDAMINQTTISGSRYNAATQLEIDTEEFHCEAAE